MIPGSFAYHRPSSVKEAVGLLGSLGDDARAIAGGHSLIPMMKLRLASPAHLIDLAGVADLKGIREDGKDIVIGPMTTQHEVIGSDLLAKKIPILAETSTLIADPQVRYVGTIGGNVANGDPGNDMPAVMMCLNATYHAVGKSGERRIAAREFYQGAYFTSLEPGEIVTAIRIPVPAAKKALQRAGLTIKDMDVIEINEAFSSQVLACLKGLEVPFDDNRVNPNGGAIAIGHPLGASGPRIALTAARQLQRIGGRYALVAMCVGVGQGIAAVIERV